jgi:predicted aspartyl protease
MRDSFFEWGWDVIVFREVSPARFERTPTKRNIRGIFARGAPYMGNETMGRVLVTARIENLDDRVLAEQGHLPQDQVRSVDVTDALVDTGATGLGMPKRLIMQLGLRPLRARQARTSAGAVTVQMFSTVRLTIQGRDCPTDVTELPDDCPVLIGQIPLESLDFVVDPSGQRVIGNPAHGGEHVIELY